MKKTLSLILSSFILASGLASCAPAGDQLDPAITLASSDATTYAQWLDNRLDEIPDDVVIGMGSNQAYGIDMSDFENDGYIIRAMDGDVMIFGKTASGLDTAVRKYAKAAEAGQTDDLNEAYHEGYRVEKLTIGGNDISTYAVVYDGPNSSVANEVVRLIQTACGAQLAIGPADAKPEAEHYFYINWIDENDDSMMELGCRYRVENGDVYIEGRYDQGVANGIYLFLQDHCGWEDLIYGDSVLLEAESIDVPADAAADYPMMADFYQPFCAFRYGSANFRSDRKFQSYGRIRQAGHGMYSHQWVPCNPWIQICYTSENSYETAYGNMVAYVETNHQAGKVIGKDLLFIDIAQVDAFAYCKCTGCLGVYREEKSSHAGAVIRFANALSEVINEEFAPEGEGIKFLLYAYHGSNNPCKTAPNDYVYVTFCTDGHCSMHTLTGGECYTESFDQAGWIEPDDGIINNADYAEWIKGWCDMSDNVYIWYYALDNNLHQFANIDQIYDDFKFLADCGVRGVFYQQDVTGLGVSRVQVQLVNMLNVDPEMTKEEYYAQVDRLLEKEYGDGWVHVREYINLLEEAEYRAGHCNNCWHYAGKIFDHVFGREYYVENFDRMTKLLELAIPMANTADQERHCELLTVSMYYVGCLFEYFEAFDTDNAERMEILNERYALLLARLRKYGYNTADVIGQDNTRHFLKETLAEEAWMDHVNHREGLSNPDVEQKPMPDEWVQYWETTEG